MAINDANINAGAKEITNLLDHATTRQQAEVVADRLRADYMDCMSQGPEGVDRWRHLVKAMVADDKKGTGFDLQVSGDSSLPVVTLFDSQKGITILGVNMGRDSMVVNEDHSVHKGFTPNAESGITGGSRRAPIEMQ